MTIRIGIVMDPISAIHYKKDSSLAMLLAAQQRNWQLSYMEPQDIYLHNGRAMGSLRPLQVFADPQRWYQLGEAEQLPLAELDVLLSFTRAWRLVKFVDAQMLTRTQCSTCKGQFVTEPYENARHYQCGLCNPPARAGKSKAAGSLMLH